VGSFQRDCGIAKVESSQDGSVFSITGNLAAVAGQAVAPRDEVIEEITDG
jgi:hypothetical protein